jgi:hypothetical protein
VVEGVHAVSYSAGAPASVPFSVREVVAAAVCDPAGQEGVVVGSLSSW